MDLLGNRIKFYKSHLASIVDIVTDESHDFIASASIDGRHFFMHVILWNTLTRLLVT